MSLFIASCDGTMYMIKIIHNVHKVWYRHLKCLGVGALKS